MNYSQPITEIIKRRFSCRAYADGFLAKEKRQQLEDFADSAQTGPFGTPLRFKLVAATANDSKELKGLGTYGMIRGAGGFLLGSVGQGDRNLEDFGYQMEALILCATDLDLGTCWLGGNFTKSSFAARMGVRDGEDIPAVTSVGNIPDEPKFMDRLIRRFAGAHSRLPWGSIFFNHRFDSPLSQEEAGEYAVPLEMVRLGPSASNKQPWRVVKGKNAWHFYLQRTPGYGQSKLSKLMVKSDLQRLDMGIALCHFELTAQEAGLAGQWTLDAEPNIEMPDAHTEYTASWIED